MCETRRGEGETHERELRKVSEKCFYRQLSVTSRRTAEVDEQRYCLPRTIASQVQRSCNSLSSASETIASHSTLAFSGQNANIKSRHSRTVLCCYSNDFARQSREQSLCKSVFCVSSTLGFQSLRCATKSRDSRSERQTRQTQLSVS